MWLQQQPVSCACALPNKPGHQLIATVALRLMLTIRFVLQLARHSRKGRTPYRMALINGLRSNREKAKGACRLIERLFGGSCVRLENGTLLQGRVAAKFALLSGLHDPRSTLSLWPSYGSRNNRHSHATS